MKMDLLKGVFLNKQWSGVAAYTGPLAELLWEGYFATRTSARSAPRACVHDQVDMLHKAVLKTKPALDELILSYRYGGSVDALLEKSLPHCKFLLQIAAYVLGYLDGPLSGMADVHEKASTVIDGSYLQPIWVRLTHELRSVHSTYPKWQDLGLYDGLMETVRDYFQVLGLEFRDIPEGVYAHVPYRPENTPPEGFLPVP